ncbi:MAG: hypothetical protein ACOYXY_02770 [Thermodesulfobacteriota bacterium]
MNDQITLDLKPNDDPLFVLRYRRGFRKFALIFGNFCCVLFFAYVAFFAPATGAYAQALKSLSVFIFLLYLSFLIDLLLFREIRLHSDRVIKVWRLLGAKEIKLADARLRSMAMTSSGLGKKGISDRNTNAYLAWVPSFFNLTGISYLEYLAYTDDVKRLNILLAQLSGRSVEEFEQTTTMERLIKSNKL